MKDIVRKLEIGLEELLLVFLIIIEAMDFFTIIHPVLEYVEKVLAIIAMCYLFYKASITRITFGRREKSFDLMIVVAYCLLSLKTLIGFVISAAEEKTAMSGFYSLVLDNAGTIEEVGFWIGGLLIIALAAFLIHEKIKKPCIMQIIQESRKARGAWQNIVHFLSIYLVLMSIFVVIFSFAIEWLALTVDAPIMMIILFFYLFVIVKRGKGMKTESFLTKIAETSEGFYERFVSLFHSRSTIATAITGLLVLHLLVDIGHFIIPYTTGLMYPWYFAQMGAGHDPLSFHMLNDFANAGTVLPQIGVLFIYTLNILAILMLFFGPAYAWYFFYKKKRVDIPPVLWLFFGSMAVFIMEPVLRMGRMNQPNLLGVDITTQSIPILQNILGVLLISALIMGIFYILGRKNLRNTTRLAFIMVFFYFGMYLYHFFVDIIKFYLIFSVTVMLQAHQYFMAAHIFIFFVIKTMFYVCGYLMFLWKGYFKQRI
ncbi:hypothetical protein ACFL3V_01780 [Nanoarchaeota archaeon]